MQRKYLDSATFDQWMQRVDLAVQHITGMSALDLPDVCYRDMFEDGRSPVSAAKHAIRNAME